MAHYQLISFKTCPWVQHAAIVLREKQIAFDFVHIESGNRPDWFHGISPHGKVPVLWIDREIALFESNAIAEYLDETIAPRLHPDDPVERAVNRAWTDYVPIFSSALGAVSSAVDEAAQTKATEALQAVFAKVQRALSVRKGDGPWFNGARYSLVDAAYAPFLQRWRIVEKLTGLNALADHPQLADWSTALIARPSTHSFPPDEFEALYRAAFVRRGGWSVRKAGLAA